MVAVIKNVSYSLQEECLIPQTALLLFRIQELEYNPSLKRLKFESTGKYHTQYKRDILHNICI